MQEPSIRSEETFAKKHGAWVWLLHSLPTLLVLAFLGGLAYWGHQSGWALPKFSALFGDGAADKDDWCTEHSVPKSICVECDESLLPRVKSVWCKKHGVHFCLFERPELAQLPSVPQITQADLDRAQRALDLKERPGNNSKCKLQERRLQLASEAVLDKMGVEHHHSATEGLIVETVTASGEITFEQSRVAPISSPVPGRTWYVSEKGKLGAAVQRGDVLALVDALDVGKAKTEFLQAFAQVGLKAKSLEYLKPLKDTGAVTDPQYREAETVLREAQIRLMGAQQTLVNFGLPLQLDSIKDKSAEELAKHLQFFGIPEAVRKLLDARTMSANLLPVLAPRDGVVTAAKTVPGENVEPSKTLFVVTDSSRMWLVLNVRAEDVKYVRVRDAKTGQPGQTVRFRPDGSDTEVSGELVWRGSQLDERTRTVPFRAELSNSDGSLFANAFGVGQIVLREEKKAIVVPNEALHWEGDCRIVFVRDKNFHKPGAPKVFHVRTVRAGVTNGAYTEIIAGLLPGEVIATKNSANLRAEVLKNNLGLG
ncbi:MAG: efflux RND transporter periplasmic adaptor subunit [Gemmataceae bacterium]|nr:efflux RND transporter periplasmic adaptor subunit [Gemmataceae bacterium]